MSQRFGRLARASTGFLAGFVAGVLTITIPDIVNRRGIPIGALTGIFVGDIFGIVIAIYSSITLRTRSVVRLAGFVVASTLAYIVAMFTTIYSAMAIGFSQHTSGTWTLASASIFALMLGGAVGAFLVLLASLLFFSNEEKLSRVFLKALQWSALGGVLGAIGWLGGPLVGRNAAIAPPVDPDTAYYYSIFLVWQTGMGLVMGILFSPQEEAESTLSNSVPPSIAGQNKIIRMAGISLFALTTLALVFFALREFPQQYRNARWQRAYNQHIADTPAMDNLQEVQALPPDQVLILNRFGEYVPGRAYTGKTHQPMDVKTLKPKAPAAQSYGVRYALPGAPTGGGNVGSHIDIQVQEYPSALWAKYEITEQGFGIDLGNPARPVKFGNQLFGQATLALNGQDGFYLWASENRLVIVQFFSADPDVILKAYLDKFPPSSVDRP